MLLSVRCAVLMLILCAAASAVAETETTRPRARDLGIQVGILPPGPLNAITDVKGVKVGHQTLCRGDSVRTGVTAIIPHDGNVYFEKMPAAVFVANGFGKAAGLAQIQELGLIETPIVLTNTLSVHAGLQGLIRYTLQRAGTRAIRSVNAVVGETNDSYLNDIQGMHVTQADVLAALEAATSGPVEEGSIGAGTGTTCCGYKGGIGTSSRRVPASRGGFTVGVLVQSNYDAILTVNGAPVGRELEHRVLMESTTATQGQGSCMIVIATDAPLSSRNLERMAGRAVIGLGRTGSIMQNGSGDFVIAFSTAYRIPIDAGLFEPPATLVSNSHMDDLFLATAEATEEAIYNSLLRARTVIGRDGHVRKAIPVERVAEICRKYNVLNLEERLPSPKEK